MVQSAGNPRPEAKAESGPLEAASSHQQGEERLIIEAGSWEPPADRGLQTPGEPVDHNRRIILIDARGAEKGIR
jgi:hypothetical protein